VAAGGGVEPGAIEISAAGENQMARGSISGRRGVLDQAFAFPSEVHDAIEWASPTEAPESAAATDALARPSSVTDVAGPPDAETLAMPLDPEGVKRMKSPPVEEVQEAPLGSSA
jgi:hypothetical protein